ncbi:M14 family zinc carboxypeptidase [Ammoniphilus sp. CFH 90114]|uniref:M14 family zinc carboxypeptidase n=1 Tax=Ammoniphilus sp. CFH 90114 TaxID=2493665 RepID=UPI00100E872B|nr:M14 family zinc carboxypeptidase [Ammoniphilus sp. CFH 90114]RXT03825.1 Tat (twin-arginine translocation) pathway signal sequence [Ammoniphilus sp. CFH 90114]
MKKFYKILGAGLLAASLVATSAFANPLTPGGPSTEGRTSMESIVTYSDMIKILEDIEHTSKGQVDVFTLDDYGVSEQGRDFYVAKVGNGPKKIWIQAQIHGDEKLVTEATLQLLKSLGTNKGDTETQKILDELTLYVIPMYNPDGAEMNNRRTLLHENGESTGKWVDLNRDWAEDKLEADESMAFYKYWVDVKPDFMVDLHHQGFKTVPGTNESTSFSLGISLAPDGPTLPYLDGKYEDKSYNEITRSAQAYVYDALKDLGYTHIDRYTVNNGKYEIDIHGGVTSAMMLGLNYQGLNPEGHSNPAIFFETKGNTREGSLGQRSNGYLTKQNYLGLRAVLFGLASGEILETDPEKWNDIPVGEIEGYLTDTGIVPKN